MSKKDTTIRAILYRYRDTFPQASFPSRRKVNFDVFAGQEKIEDAHMMFVTEEWQYDDNILYVLTLENLTEKTAKNITISANFGDDVIRIEDLKKNEKHVFKHDDPEFYMELDSLKENDFKKIKIITKGDSFESLEITSDNADVEFMGVEVDFEGLEMKNI